MPPSSIPRSVGVATLLLLLQAVPAAALDYKETIGHATLEVRSDAARPAIALADVVRVIITVKGSKGLRVNAPARPIAGTGWDVLASPAPQTQADGDFRWQQTLTLAPTTPGELKLELTPLFVHDGGDEKIAFKPLTVTVETQIKDIDPRQTRDITATEELPAPPGPALSYLWFALVPVGVAVLGGLWLILGQRAGARPATALRKAMRECDRLMAMQLPVKQHGKSFVALLTGIVRRYLERRYDLPARRQTTVELLRAVDARADIADESRRWLHTFFTQTDLVKFAGADISAARCTELADEVRQFCRTTSAPPPTRS